MRIQRTLSTDLSVLRAWFCTPDWCQEGNNQNYQEAPSVSWMKNQSGITALGETPSSPALPFHPCFYRDKVWRLVAASFGSTNVFATIFKWPLLQHSWVPAMNILLQDKVPSTTLSKGGWWNATLPLSHWSGLRAHKQISPKSLLLLDHCLASAWRIWRVLGGLSPLILYLNLWGWTVESTFGLNWTFR